MRSRKSAKNVVQKEFFVFEPLGKHEFSITSFEFPAFFERVNN